MPEEHFNGLTSAEAERLVILAEEASEEASEVVHACMKILRHGSASTDPTKNTGESNRTMLERELGNLEYATQMMIDADDVEAPEIARRARQKATGKKYLHHQ